MSANCTSKIESKTKTEVHNAKIKVCGCESSCRYSYLAVMEQEGKISKEGKVDNHKDVVATFLPGPMQREWRHRVRGKT